MAGGLWMCGQFGSSGAEGGCVGDAIWGAAVFGAVGLLLGSLAGQDAER
jgi:hypothetical protein